MTCEVWLDSEAEMCEHSDTNSECNECRWDRVAREGLERMMAADERLLADALKRTALLQQAFEEALCETRDMLSDSNLIGARNRARGVLALAILADRCRP